MLKIAENATLYRCSTGGYKLVIYSDTQNSTLVNTLHPI